MPAGSADCLGEDRTGQGMSAGPEPDSAFFCIIFQGYIFCKILWGGRMTNSENEWGSLHFICGHINIVSLQ